MRRFYIVVIFGILLSLEYTESLTYQKDVDDLEDIRNLVLTSGISLSGWSYGTDPCGDIVPCGINDLYACDWEGIACAKEDSLNRIIGIALQGRGPGLQLWGTLPKILPERLRSLSLADNALTGNLQDPGCSEFESECSDIWWKNTVLTVIDLEGNRLQGKIPEWKNLVNLESITLSRNQFNGTLPNIGDHLIYLRRMDVSNNRLTGSLPESWSQMTSLEYIQLANNFLERQIPSSWFDLPSLVLLDVSGNCALCGTVPEQRTFAIYGNGTQLNRGCSDCNGCNCKNEDLKFIITNVLISFVVLGFILCGYILFRCYKSSHSESNQLPVTDPFSQTLPRKPQRNPTLVVNPDQSEVYICCQVELSHQQDPEESEEDMETSEGISEGDSSDYDLYSESESIDPEVLDFLYKTPSMLAFPDRSWSEEIAGPSEILTEGCSSDCDGKSTSSKVKHRKAKSVIEDRSTKNLSKSFIENRKSAKRVAELTPTPKRPKNKHRRRKPRTFRRRNHYGLTGTMVFSDPRQIRLSESVGPVVSINVKPES